MATSSKASSITLLASDILIQIGAKLKAFGNFNVTVPKITTCKTAVTSTLSALGNDDRQVMLIVHPSATAREKLRRLALEDNSLHESTSIQTPLGLPIRPAADVKDLPRPQRANENIRQKLREDAKTWKTFPDPYPIIVQANVAEQTLATVSGQILLHGIDSTQSDPYFDITSESILFDTGSHYCVIVEDLLPPDFREYLRSPPNDPYYSEDRTRVHVDGSIVFSNQVFQFNAIFLVVPRRAVPNGGIGIILGQRGLLNRMTYRSIPRDILRARGNHVEEGIWGDIILEEFLTLDDELLTL